MQSYDLFYNDIWIAILRVVSACAAPYRLEIYSQTLCKVFEWREKIQSTSVLSH